jgi:hypothetical protein
MEAHKRLNYPYLITRDTCPSRANLEVFRFSPSDGCPATATCLASTQALDPDACPPLRSFSVAATRAVRLLPPPRRLDRPKRSDCPSLAVELAWVAAPPHRVFSLGFVAQPSNLVFSCEPMQTPRTRCSLFQSPLMTSSYSCYHVART